MGKLYEIFGTDAHAMTLALLEAADVQVPPSASVALKPNLVNATPPEYGATTHPGVLSGCIEYLQRRGVKYISVIEGSWVGGRTEDAVRVCGYDRVCQRYGVPFINLKHDKTRAVPTPLRDMDICERALDADLLIDLPVLKGHCQTAMTCALKNLKGCLPDREKRRFHAEGLTRPIAALGAALKPGLVIVDSLCGDLNFEEGGNPVPTNRMYLCTDPVQADAYGCRLMGLDLSDVPYISRAAEWGAGSVDISPSDVIPLNEPKTAAACPSPANRIRQLTRNVWEDSACSACYASLVRALYIAKEEGIPVRRDLSIGQGWRGKDAPGLGIGNCCAGGFVACKGCPPTAADIVAFLKRYGG